MKRRQLAAIIICALTISLVSACSLERRKPLTLGEITQPLPSQNLNVLVDFEEVIPTKPLPETVWDNVSGPFWNVTESNQIGFTQHYKAQFFAIPPPLLPAAAQSGANLVDSQIMMPFGRTFTGVFEAALKKSVPRYYICYDKACSERAMRQGDYDKTLRITIRSFFVWEGPLNHLNLYAKGSYKLIGKDGVILKEKEFERDMLKLKLGSVLSTHSGFISEMNRLLNKFAEDISVELINNLNS